MIRGTPSKKRVDAGMISAPETVCCFSKTELEAALNRLLRTSGIQLTEVVEEDPPGGCTGYASPKRFFSLHWRREQFEDRTSIVAKWFPEGRGEGEIYLALGKCSRIVDFPPRREEEGTGSLRKRRLLRGLYAQEIPEIMVLVDSDVWSGALRKKGKGSPYTERLRELIELDEVVMIGPIRQEILSGIREKRKFEEIRERLKAFPSERLEDSIHELAASFFNRCRSRGIQGSHTDFLKCACGVAWEVSILNMDKDFKRYSQYIPIELEKLKG